MFNFIDREELENFLESQKQGMINNGLFDCKMQRSEPARVDVRLQVIPSDEYWNVHVGDAQYDTDHSGYWGASCIGPNTDVSELVDSLISEAQDLYCMTEESV